MQFERAPDLNAIRDAFMKAGVAFWPALLSDGQAADMRRQAIELEERRTRDAGADNLPPHLIAMAAQRTSYLNDFQLGQLAAPQALTDLVAPVASAYLEHLPASTANSFVRHIGPDRKQSYLPFHQDENILRQRMVNVWIALDPAGEDAPGIEFILGISTLLPTAPDPSGIKRPWDPIVAKAIDLPDERRYRPVFRPGDAVIFAGTTPHRTYDSGRMNSSRRSVELRLV